MCLPVADFTCFMDSRSILGQILAFVLYFLAQMGAIRYFVVFDGLAACYLYIAFLLLLPFETDRTLLLFLGFFTGFLTDLFYDTLGIHAAAAVGLAFVRPVVIQLLTPRGGYDDNPQISLAGMGIAWFLPYTLLLVFVHHLLLFLIEASRWELFFQSLLKTLLSTVFTGIVIFLTQYLFYRKQV
jgi:hypothetical protein